MHDHGPRVVWCAGCGEQRWCGIGPCRSCGVVTPCPGDVEHTGVVVVQWNGGHTNRYASEAEARLAIARSRVPAEIIARF